MTGRRLRTAESSTKRSTIVPPGPRAGVWFAVGLLATLLIVPIPGVRSSTLAANPLELRQARLGVTPERTRLVFEFSRPAFTHRWSAVGDTALDLRLPGTKRAGTFRGPSAPDGLFRALRLRDAGDGVLEARVSFSAPAEVRIFRVEAEGGKPARLVVDLYAGKGKGKAALPVPAPPKSPEVAPTKSPQVAPPKSPQVPAPEPASKREEVAAPVVPRAEVPAAGAEVTPPAGFTVPAAADSSSGPRRAGPRIVVIDPGHGGGDPGAVGKGLQEKDVCLDVASRLAAALNETPGYRAVITRTDDRFVSLSERMRFAEKQGADLFVSIHVNAARSSRAAGAEVFFLSIGAATDRAAAELARLENEADPDFVVEEDEALKQLPFAVSLRQSDTLLRSSRIAEVVLDVLTSRGLAESRGVKQAGFAVLKSFQVPSILVEVGFISSQAERKKLKSPEHRQKLADALTDGVKRYFDRYAPARPNP